MSGGSWDYFCFRLDDPIDQLLMSKDIKRVALGRKLALIQKALHDIEWVDSGDYGEGDEIPAIDAVITEQDCFAVLEDRAVELIEQLKAFVKVDK